MSKSRLCCFFFNDTATTEIYTLSLHDALPIYIIAGELELWLFTLELELWLLLLTAKTKFYIVEEIGRAHV